MTPRRALPGAGWAALGWAAVICALTLRPSPSTLTTPGFCLLCGERGLADALLNIALFAPLGAALRGLGWKVSLLTLLGAAFALSIETVQFFTPGRDASVGDVLFDAIGTLVGGLAAPILPRLLRPRDAPAAARLALAWGLACALGTAGVAWLLEPTIPDAPLELEDRPMAPQGGRFEGQVISRRVDGEPRPEGSRIEADRLAGAHPQARIDVRFTAAAARFAFRPVIGLADPGLGGWPFLLGPQDEDLIFRVMRRAASLRLTRADLRLKGAFASAAPGDTLLAGFSTDGEGWCLRMDARVECGFGHTAGSGWTLLMPQGLADGHRSRWFDAVWLGVWMIPLGFWSRPLPAARLGLALVLGAVALVPWLSSLLAAPVYTFGGVLGGWAAGRMASRLGRPR